MSIGPATPPGAPGPAITATQNAAAYQTAVAAENARHLAAAAPLQAAVQAAEQALQAEQQVHQTSMQSIGLQFGIQQHQHFGGFGGFFGR
jgi:hypothetical protein